MTPDGTLTRNQKRVIPALLTYRHVEEAAAAVGIGKRTLLRWLAEDATFRQALAKAEGQAIDAAARQLVSLADEAVNTLRDLMDSETASDSVRLRAADAVLGHLFKLRELRSIEERLTALEEKILHDGN